MALVLNEIIQDRATGPSHILENRTTIIQSLVVLDDQAVAAQMYTMSDVLQKMIQHLSKHLDSQHHEWKIFYWSMS
jgi:hemerythrin-like domain-containing protein